MLKDNLEKFSYCIFEMYVVCTHKNRSIEAILMITLNKPLYYKDRKDIPKLSQFASRLGAMINHLGPVVRSVVSLTSSLVVKMLTVIVSTISNS